ncbi:MAG: hypothetical protein VX498_00755, partial [Myxococcota bacterium]|nr:hypothetical protein [Myxococcota bacterium]
MSRPYLDRVLGPLRALAALGRARLRRMLLVILVALSVGVGLVWLALSSPVVVSWAVQAGLPRVNERIPGEISVSGWGGTLGGGLHLSGVEVKDEVGRPVITVGRLEIEPRLTDLLAGTIHVERLELTEPMVLLEQRTDRPMGIVAAFVSPALRPKTERGPPSYSWVMDLSVDS